MRKLFWSACIEMIVLLFIASNAQQTSAQQRGLEQAREPVSDTGRFGERSREIKPRVSEEDTKSGVVSTVDYGRPMSKIQARRLKAVLRDPALKITKGERPPGQKLVAPSAVFRGGLELAREPVSPIGTFGEKSDAPEVKVEEEDDRPGLIRPTDYDRSISNEEARRLKKVRRDPDRKVIKGRRP